MASPKVLSFGKTQINLVFRSLNRTFALSILHPMKRFVPYLSWLGALLLIAFALIFFESDLLWKVQHYNLFLNTSHFFREQMVVPGGFLSYVSCFFTQFFYYPWLGVLLLCAWWLLLTWLVKHVFRMSNQWTVVALIPAVLLLIANMDLGYWHYFMRLRGYFFVATIGTTVAVAMLWAFRKASSPDLSNSKWNLWIRIALIIVAAVVGYPLFGIYALAAVLLMAIWTWRLSNNRKQNAILTVVALLCMVAVPLLCYRYVYYQTNIHEVWTAGLPDFTVVEHFPRYYIPYYILMAFFLWMVIKATPDTFMKRGEESKKQPKIAKKKPLIMWGLQGVLAVALFALVYHYWYKDKNFHHELVMQHCIEQTDWEGVIDEAQKVEEPTRPIVIMRNIALWRLGRQLGEMNSFPAASKDSNTPIPVDMVYHVFGRMTYYQYGMLNDCHRICMEEGVEYGWHVETQKYLARCSMLTGEKQAARKSLNLLRHTLFHGKWAEDMLQLLDQPKQMTENAETGPITHMLHYHNALGSDGGKVEKYIMGQLSQQDADDPYFQEQALLATLWMKDSKTFFPRFNHYARLHTSGPMPHLFQEAAYLFGMIENTPNLERFPFDKSVIQTYNAFMNEAVKYNDQPAKVGRAALRPIYGNTYFYEYYYGQRPN